MHSRLLLITPFLTSLLPAFASAQISAHAGISVAVPSIRVEVPPPAVRVEVQSAAPGPEYVWIQGYWGWDDRGRGRHVWVPGHWERPPARHYVWAPARWDRRGRHHIYYRGHWAYQAPPQEEVYVDEPEPPPQEEVYVSYRPPRPIVERRPPRPWRSGIWISGRWYWTGERWSWIGGRWERNRPGYHYRAARWERSSDGRWAYHRHRWEPRPGPRRGPGRAPPGHHR